MHTDMTAAELGAAWRLAYVVTRDREAATATVGAARAETPAGDGIAVLAATWSRLGTVFPEPKPDASLSGSLDAAFWDLGPEQRVALWITEVEGLSLRASASVLGIGEHRTLRLLEQARQGLVTIPPGPGCPPIARLGRYAVGDLAAVDAAAVDDHVVRCRTCRARCNQIEDTSGLPAALARMVPGPPIDLGRPPTIDDIGEDERFAAFFDTGAGDDAPTGQIAAVARPRPGRLAWLSACSAGVFVAGIAGAVAIHPDRLASQLRDPPSLTSIPPSLSTTTIAPKVLQVTSTTTSSSTSTTTSSTTTTTVSAPTSAALPSATSAPAPTAPVLSTAATVAPPATTLPGPPTGTTTPSLTASTTAPATTTTTKATATPSTTLPPGSG